jgi:hypothetical protein
VCRGHCTYRHAELSGQSHKHVRPASFVHVYACFAAPARGEANAPREHTRTCPARPPETGGEPTGRVASVAALRPCPCSVSFPLPASPWRAAAEKTLATRRSLPRRRRSGAPRRPKQGTELAPALALAEHRTGTYILRDAATCCRRGPPHPQPSSRGQRLLPPVCGRFGSRGARRSHTGRPGVPQAAHSLPAGRTQPARRSQTGCPQVAQAARMLHTGCPQLAQRLPAGRTGCPHVAHRLPAGRTACPHVAQAARMLHTTCPQVAQAARRSCTACPQLAHRLRRRSGTSCPQVAHRLPAGHARPPTACPQVVHRLPAGRAQAAPQLRHRLPAGRTQAARRSCTAAHSLPAGRALPQVEHRLPAGRAQPGQGMHTGRGIHTHSAILERWLSL